MNHMIEVEWIGRRGKPYTEKLRFLYYDESKDTVRCPGFMKFKLATAERAVLSIRGPGDQVVYENPAALHAYINRNLSNQERDELRRLGQWYLTPHTKRLQPRAKNI